LYPFSTFLREYVNSATVNSVHLLETLANLF
jgi:hypothetical protein